MRGRSGARAALGLGLAASLVGNVAGAPPTLVGRAVAGWTSIALAVAVVLVERTPVGRSAAGAGRLIATAGLALAAGVVSFGHLHHLAADVGGEHGAAAVLVALTPDWLIAVGALTLRQIGSEAAPVARPRPARATAPSPPPAPSAARSGPPVAAQTVQATAPGPHAIGAAPAGPGARGRTTPVPAEQVRALAAGHPDWTHRQIAAALGCSTRTVSRHLAGAGDDHHFDDELAELVATTTPSTNGAHP